MISFQAAERFARLGSELATVRVIEERKQSKQARRLRRRADPQGLPPSRSRGSIPSWRCSASSAITLPERPLAARLVREPRPAAESTLGVLQAFVPARSTGGSSRSTSPSRLRTASRPAASVGRGHRCDAFFRAAAPTEDPVFAAEEPSPEALGLLTATIDEEIQRVFLDLPDDVEALEPIRLRGEEIRERLRQRAYAGAAGRVIRSHGDFHLGQSLPPRRGGVGDHRLRRRARAVAAERRRKRSPLRDVAGMLRSFAYAASAVEPCAAARRRRSGRSAPGRSSWRGTAAASTRRSSPPGPDAFEKLLSVFELEKAGYELRYELTMRPDWLPIPVTGIRRILEEEPVTT